MKRSGFLKILIFACVIFSVMSLGVTGPVTARTMPAALVPEQEKQEPTQTPGKGVPLFPNGTTESNPLHLVWQIDPDATKYWLWIDSPTTGQIVWDQMVSLEEVDCQRAVGSCAFDVPAVLAEGAYIWWVLPSNELGHGVWSDSLPFNLVSTSSAASEEAQDAAPHAPEQAPAVEETQEPLVEDPLSTGASQTLSPDNMSVENPVTFSWQVVTDATAYWLWLDDDSGQKIWDQWVTMEEASCSDNPSCTFILPIDLEPGKYNWWLLASSDHEHGAWTTPRPFWILPSSFDQLPGQGVVLSPIDAVVENPIRLSWQPDPFAKTYWLWIDNSMGEVAWDQWVDAFEAGCAFGESACVYDLQLELDYGHYSWWVMPSNDLGYGAWSQPVGLTLFDGSCSLPQVIPEGVRQWCALIDQAAMETGLPATLIAAVIFQESKGNPLAYSSSGAVGLMQVMPRDGIAKNFMCAGGPCFADRPSIAELQDPAFNVAYGSRFLADLFAKYGTYREALYRYGPINMGYYYADKVLGIWNTYK